MSTDEDGRTATLQPLKLPVAGLGTGTGVGVAAPPGTTSGARPGKPAAARTATTATATTNATATTPWNAYFHRPGRLVAGVAWAALLLGLWLWGRDLADGVAAQLATTGDVAAVGRPLGRQGPAHAHAPVPAAAAADPVGLTIEALGVRAAGIAARDLDAHGLLAPPPPASPDAVGWYAGGPQPGETGAALLVGRAGADRGSGAGRIVFRRLTGLKPGQRVDVRRADGSTARFTVEDVRLYDRDRFVPHRVYAPHDPGRSELRLIVDDGRHGGALARRAGGPAKVVVVSAYLTSFQAGNAGAGRQP
ncbi:sortase [Streptomyces sp. TM32]|uniref:sortase domain-containing protein n=1 Tax=Streptomyces sp. TM32 TaxID=1652669 RepID=UPI0020B128FD|nr:sortase [Streptomyces sp. TM32]